MIEIRQKVPAPKIKNIVSKIRKELRRVGLQYKIKPGMKIAITAGSRGIAKYADILKTVVEEVKRTGGIAFIVPAMGSHGGATPDGQLKVLESLGITCESVGAPIRATMEVKEIGRLGNGMPVYLDRIAAESDGIVVVNRVKPHTDFKGQIESGLMKMIVIGLGKQKGAHAVHRYQSEGYHRNLPLAARLIIETSPIVLGLAIVENAEHDIAAIKALNPEEIEKGEAKMLKMAKKLLGRIPFKKIDLLIIDEIGKDISGTGMDTNVTGRFWVQGEYDPEATEIKRIVVLDISEKSHGNALGIGLADLTTKRLVEKIDLHSTFVNSLSNCWPELSKIPVYLENDREDILTGLDMCGPIDPTNAKIVRIRNTLRVDRMWISESLLESVKSDNRLSEIVEIVGGPKEMQFDMFGMLVT
jgi:hypothetical protein